MTVNPRPYRQTRRAEKKEETRRRIVEAAVRLHSTVGPSQASLSRVAEEARVSRPTLYAHFPDEGALLQACTLHSLALDPPPDPERWLEIADPRKRLRTALDELYVYYERNETLTANTLRDLELVPAMELNRRMLEYAFGRMREILAGDDRRCNAAVAVALDFHTWQALHRMGLDRQEAVGLMAEFVGRCRR